MKTFKLRKPKYFWKKDGETKKIDQVPIIRYPCYFDNVLNYNGQYLYLVNYFAMLLDVFIDTKIKYEILPAPVENKLTTSW